MTGERNKQSEIEFIRRSCWWLEERLPFISSNDEHVIDVEMSNWRIGEPFDVLFTDNLEECLGVGLCDKKNRRCALAHILPAQPSEEIVREMLCELNTPYKLLSACIVGERGQFALENSTRVIDFLTGMKIKKTYIELGGDDRRALCIYPRSNVCHVINQSRRTSVPVKLDGNEEKYVRLPSRMDWQPIVGGIYDQ